MNFFTGGWNLIIMAKSASKTVATVLLVEPHEPTQLVIMLALEPVGVGVLPVFNKEEAIAAARLIKFSACISETRLPDGSGLDLADELLELQPNIRVLYYATSVTPEEAELITRRGETLLHKPVCMVDLRQSAVHLLVEAGLPVTANATV